MANIESAKKRNRQDIKRTIANKSAMNKLRTFVRKVEDSITSGNKEEASKSFADAQSVIAKVAKKGIIHKNNAGRKISKLFARVKALS